MLTNFWRSIKSANEVWREVVFRNEGGRPEIAQFQHHFIFIYLNRCKLIYSIMIYALLELRACIFKT